MTVEEMLEEVVRQLRDYEHFVSLVSPHIEAILPVYQRGTMTETMQDLCRAYLKVRPKEEIHSETENQPACGAHSPGDDPRGD
jgi:hypothetical protein